MASDRPFSKKDKRFFRVAVLGFILLCLFIGFCSFQYYQQLQKGVQAESESYIQELSTQMGGNIGKILSDKYAALSAIAEVLCHSELPDYQALSPLLSSQQKLWGYQRLLLFDKNGVAHDDTGAVVPLFSDEYLQDTIVKRQNSLSTSQVIDGRESIVFAIPLDGVSVGDTPLHALATCYDLATFDQILSMTAFNGSCYAHIVRKDGTIVVRSSSANAQKLGYNILNSLESAKIRSGDSLQHVKENIASGKNGQTEFTINGIREYMNYTALGNDNWSLLTFVPVEIVNQRTDTLLRITLLMCGAITAIFALLFGGLMFSTFRNKRRLERIAYVDPVTGGHTIERFYELMQEAIFESDKTDYALIYANIKNFKVLNEQLGKSACDVILRSLENSIAQSLISGEYIGRISADNFCILLHYAGEASLMPRFEEWQEATLAAIAKEKTPWIPLFVEFGVYVLLDRTLPLPQMVDRAKLALTETDTEFHGNIRYSLFNEKLRSALLREKQLEDRMDNALKNGEFVVYLQPKYHTKSEKISGAEALVRWFSPREGMIYPDEFIPLFERNHFIVQLDMAVFEQVCKTMQGWLRRGLPPIKISVNCSRMHLSDPNFLEKYCAVARSYGIPFSYLEIELTETTVFEDFAHLTQVITQIHQAGFGCSMDDFGSGYSSLNLIQDIPVDTLKLDKVFFRGGGESSARTESVVGSVIAMSKALSMETVAEGVEERAQVDMLKRLNCDYIQGYYFAKPMPISEFEALAFPGENGAERNPHA
ncbi:MAG: EAL domain-containing protein [Oscillospiraceae bacterium]